MQARAASRAACSGAGGHSLCLTLSFLRWHVFTVIISKSEPEVFCSEATREDSVVHFSGAGISTFGEPPSSRIAIYKYQNGQ